MLVIYLLFIFIYCIGFTIKESIDGSNSSEHLPIKIIHLNDSLHF